MADPESISIEVVYALPDEQCCLNLTLPKGSTLRQAIEASGILDRYPQIDLAVNKVGMFGRLRRLQDRLRDGDRVEIYRPLIADPKEARRRRAARKSRRP